MIARGRRSCLAGAFVAAALLISYCGGEPPDKEIQQAQGAIDAARAAGAEQYAKEEFTAAEDALKHANEAVAVRDYRLALNHALDARERARNAAKETADRKASARVEADRALRAATDALDQAKARLKAADAARAPARTLGQAKAVVEHGEASVQEARAMLDKGDYKGAVEVLVPATSQLRAAARGLEVGKAPASKRN
jgi:hypothetical protein